MVAAQRRTGPVERASATDRAFLAMDRGTTPEQFGVLLVLPPGGDGTPVPDLTQVREKIAGRLGAVPRLRQRLVGSPPGAGGPVWVDDPMFDVANHVHASAGPISGDEQAMLDRALAVVATPLPRQSPLWSVTMLPGLSNGAWALVVVLHHVLADGVGGLAVLGALLDASDREASPGENEPAFPRPRPTSYELYADAIRRRVRSLRGVPRGWRQLRDAMSAAGGARPRRAATTSLLQRTGPRREARVVHVDLETLREAVHPAGATVNDAVLVAVAGAVGRVQSGHGEQLPRLMVTVPVSGRDPSNPGSVGNLVSPLLVPVPTTGQLVDRLQSVGSRIRSGREAAAGSPPPIALLGWIFRPMARLGGFRWYMNHQHRMHTVVSHVRGPRRELRFDGWPIEAAIPIGVGETGNTTVHFQVLSYAGDLALTVIADPDHFRDLDVLVGILREELDLLRALPPGCAR